VFVAPGAPGVTPEELGQPGLAQPAQCVRVGVAGGQEPQRRVIGQISTEGCVPAGAEQLEVGIETG